MACVATVEIFETHIAGVLESSTAECAWRTVPHVLHGVGHCPTDTGCGEGTSQERRTP